MKPISERHKPRPFPLADASISGPDAPRERLPFATDAREAVPRADHSTGEALSGPEMARRGPLGAGRGIHGRRQGRADGGRIAEIPASRTVRRETRAGRMDKGRGRRRGDTCGFCAWTNPAAAYQSQGPRGRRASHGDLKAELAPILAAGTNWHQFWHQFLH